MRGTWLWAVVSTGGIISACAADAPPYQDLKLRDALGADPTVLAGLPSDAREMLLHRMLATRDLQTEREALPNEKGRSPAAEVNAIDHARAERDEDSLLVWKARAEGGSIIAEPQPDPRAVDGKDGGDGSRLEPLPELPALEGTPPDATSNAESRALAGEGGRTVRELMKITGAKRVSRVVGWPAAVAAIDDTVYVNAGWLVLLADNEPDAGAAPGISFAVKPAALRGNPYRLYATLAECRNDVTSRCQSCLSSGSCDEDATLEDFADGRQECAYLLEPRAPSDGGPDAAAPVSRIDELCAMSLLSVSTVAECVRDERCAVPTGSRKSTSLPAADAFLRDDRCVRALNLCLSGSDEGSDAGPRPFTLIDVKVSGCSDPFAACSSSCKGCDNACSSGKCSGGSGPSCKSCSSCATCSGCGSSTRGGDSSGYGSGGSGNPAPVPTGSSGGGGSGGGGSGGGGSGGGSSDSSGGCGKSKSGGSSSDSKSCKSASCNACSSSGSSSSGSSSSNCGSCKSSGGSGSGNCRCETAGVGGTGGAGGGAPPMLAGGSGPSSPSAYPTSATTMPAPSSPLAPASTFFWLGLPLAYLAKHARARKDAPKRSFQGGVGT
ncbi:hypothetical protein [Pendulispora albinea]|uniref:Uncharacterized protein n=1 Tax=Pendulispora albinea TaxID=2741071 RepID=A0ABZ2M5X3_9BACT